MSNSIMGFGGAPNVVAILRNVKTGEETRHLGHNIITDQGDAFYARRGAGSGDTFTVAGLKLGSGLATPAKGDNDVGTVIANGSVAVTGGWPKVSDATTGNEGYGSVDSVTWKFDFGTAAGNGTVAEGAITNTLSAGATACICHFLFGTAFTKTSSDTLTVFVNHNYLGS